MYRKVRTTQSHYIPVQWGTKIEGGTITAWANLVRTGKAELYAFYGDDADCYRAFEEDGFTISKVVSNFEEADKWLKEEVFGG